MVVELLQATVASSATPMIAPLTWPPSRIARKANPGHPGRRTTSGTRPGLHSHVTYEIHEVTELRVSVPETGRRLLPLPVAAWHATVGRALLVGVTVSEYREIEAGDRVPEADVWIDCPSCTGARSPSPRVRRESARVRERLRSGELRCDTKPAGKTPCLGVVAGQLIGPTRTHNPSVAGSSPARPTDLPAGSLGP